MSGFGSYEVLPPIATPVHYGIDEGATDFTDPDQGSEYLGSNAELGGVLVETGEYDLMDNDVGEEGAPVDTNPDGSPASIYTATVNLTGMSESPMTPVTAGANVNGAGQTGQQVPSRAAAEGWISQIYESVARGLTRQGLQTTNAAQAAPAAGVTAPPTLVQTGAHGISLHGNLVLFFLIGVIIAVVVFD